MHNKKLIINLDGIGYSWLFSQYTPFLNRFAKENYSIKLNTFLAFTGLEYSFFTGKPPNEHNIWVEFKYSPKTSLFSWQRPFSFLRRRAIDYLTVFHQLVRKRTFLVKTNNIPFSELSKFDVSTKSNIWDLDYFKDKSYICYKWPFFVKNGSYKIIPFYESGRKKCERLFKSISNDIDVYVTQLVDIDKVFHKYGIDSDTSKEQLSKFDSLIKEVVERFQNVFKDIDIILWSDHGFINIQEYINLQALLPKVDGYTVFLGGTTASFWFESVRGRKIITGFLNKQNFGKILSQKERYDYKIPSSNIYGEIIFLMNSGSYICPNYYQPKKEFVAMHGWAPSDEFDAILLTNMSTDKKSLRIDEVYEHLLK